LLAKVVNDKAGSLTPRAGLVFFREQARSYIRITEGCQRRGTRFKLRPLSQAVTCVFLYISKRHTPSVERLRVDH
jgi:hypothetical protein